MVNPSHPEISVIVPTYNRARLVKDCIQSIIDQNYPSYEIIVVDDGSNDSTQETMSMVMERNPQVKYIFRQNGGPSAARNTGLATARGAYIAFLDSDDFFEPGKLALQVEYLKHNPNIGLVHSGFIKFNDAGGRLGYRDTSWFNGWVYPQILLHWTTLIPPSTVMVRREVLDGAGTFDESLHIAEDLDLWRRIARISPFGVIKQSLTLVRVHPDNSSGNPLNASTSFEIYLRKAFKEDETLSPAFQRRAMSQMYSNAAYNLLSEKGMMFARPARRDARRAIQNDLMNVNGYLSFGASFLPYAVRARMAVGWRAARGYFMQQNRKP